MKLEHVTLTEVRMPLKFRFETSHGVTSERRVLLLRLYTTNGEGVAECVAGEDAGYSYETVDTAWTALMELIAPAALGREIDTPAQLGELLAPMRGHNMAKAALECAFWDVCARATGQPLWQALGGVRNQVAVGVSLGIQPTVEATLAQVTTFLDQGYRRIKLKIKPGHDVEFVRAVREAYPTISLTVDANSAYSLGDMRILRELDAFRLDYIEQPFAHNDLHDHARLQSEIATPLCLDESIHSPADTRKALATGAARVINIKIGRMGGLLSARQAHDVSAAFSAPVWCGGMLEAGVGRAFNLALSTLPNFTLPGDTASSSRYWARDIVHEELEAKNGWMQVPPGPGSGITVDWDYVSHIAVRTEELPAR